MANEMPEICLHCAWNFQDKCCFEYGEYEDWADEPEYCFKQA